jgi:uracil-DNA glycosylase
MSWKAILQAEKEKPYFQEIIRKVQEDAKQHTIYPPHKDVFNAFKYCPYDKTKALILGQDPYHSEGQAHGLAFSVQPGVDIPPSLRNIYEELFNDLDIEPANHGCLIPWARQGVLLLNAALTVRKGQAGSHQDIGWKQFTDHIISMLNERSQPMVFLLWGTYARSKRELITNARHLVLETSHPSPLSAYRGFMGCGHFSQTNSFLTTNNIDPIDWRLQ